MEILLANPRGFCAGVDRAITIVERVLSLFGAPVYVRHEVVHNRFVVEGLRRRGAIFVDDLAQVPDGATLIFSAHGVPQAVRQEARARGLRVFDATCPLVTKVHLEVVRYCRAGYEVVLIGHRGHPEVEGTMGQTTSATIHLVETPEDVTRLQVTQKNPSRMAFVTQTTLSMDDAATVIEALRQRFPEIRGPKRSDICYATQNRQEAVKALARGCDRVLIVGSPNSSNSNRLREIAEKLEVPAHLIDGPDDIDPAWLAGSPRVGLSAGASAPEVLVAGVVARLQAWGATAVREQEGIEERIMFSLPAALQGIAPDSASPTPVP
ncbi:MAG: 4-hydroxy-3-methylbut-2-enyl diphosphate reductase [Pseudomonadota bacterium]